MTGLVIVAAVVLGLIGVTYIGLPRLARRIGQARTRRILTQTFLVPASLVDHLRDGATTLVTVIADHGARTRAAAVRSGWFGWAVVAVVVGIPLWLLGARTAFSIDYFTFQDVLHYPSYLVSLAPVLIIAINELIGLALWDVVGVTHILPLSSRPWARVVAAVVVLVALVAALHVQADLAAYRSERLAASRAAAEATLPNPAAAPSAVARGESVNSTADVFIGVGAALLEILLSFTLVWALLVAWALVVALATLPLRLFRFLLAWLHLGLERGYQLLLTLIGGGEAGERDAEAEPAVAGSTPVVAAAAGSVFPASPVLAATGNGHTAPSRIATLPDLDDGQAPDDGGPSVTDPRWAGP